MEDGIKIHFEEWSLKRDAQIEFEQSLRYMKETIDRELNQFTSWPIDTLHIRELAKKISSLSDDITFRAGCLKQAIKSEEK